MNTIKIAKNILLLKNRNFLVSSSSSICLNKNFYSKLLSPTVLVSSKCFINENQNNNFNVYFNDIKRYYAKKSKKDDKSSVKKPKVELNNEELNSIINFNDLVSDMNKIVNQLKEDYAKNLSLRLNSNTIEDIQVKTPEGTFKISEIGQVVLKSSNLYLIDMINSPQYIQKVCDSINKSGIGLTPQIDKTTIYLNLPKLTREHRENLSKSAKKIFETHMGKLRDLNKKASRKVSDNKTASVDLIFQINENIKYQYTLHVKEAEKIRDSKQAELLAEK